MPGGRRGMLRGGGGPTQAGGELRATGRFSRFGASSNTRVFEAVKAMSPGYVRIRMKLKSVIVGVVAATMVCACMSVSYAQAAARGLAAPGPAPARVALAGVARAPLVRARAAARRATARRVNRGRLPRGGHLIGMLGADAPAQGKDLPHAVRRSADIFIAETSGLPRRRERHCRS